MKLEGGSFLTLAALVVALGGCSTGTDSSQDPVKVIAEAKKSTQRAERQIVDWIPPGDRVSADQKPDGALVSCGSGKQWSGTTRILLAENVSPAELFDEITPRAQDGGYDVEGQASTEGDPRLRLSAAGGETLYLSPRSGRAMDLDSFSNCFTLPDGFQTRGNY